MATDFRGLAQSLAQKGMAIAGTLLDTIVYNSVSSSTYDPNLGVIGETTKTYTFGAVIARFGSKEIDGKDILPTDARMTVAYLDLPVEPKPYDNFMLKGRVWKPVKVLSPPGNPIWTIQIRAV